MTWLHPNTVALGACKQVLIWLFWWANAAQGVAGRQAGRHRQALKRGTYLEGGGGTPDRHGA